MTNEDLIYRITRAVYDRLGNAIDDSTVEQLVTDIYNQVRTNSTAAAPADLGAMPTGAAEGSSARMVISVFGLDPDPRGSELQYHRHQPNSGSGEVCDGDHRRHFARA
jgi:hypothetical protein